MPLYPFLMSFVYRTQPADVWGNAVLVIQSFSAWCSTIMIALVAHRLADGRAGLIAGLIVALYAPFSYLQMSFLTENLLIFLLSGALLLYVTFGLDSDSIGKRLLALFGVSLLLGFAVLTRANALLMLLPFGIDTVFRGGTIVQRSSRVAAIIIPALVCVSIWASRNHRELGVFTLSSVGGLNFYLGHNPDYADHPGLDRADYDIANRLRAERHFTELQADRHLYSLGFDFIRNHPAEAILYNSFRKIRVWFSPSVPAYGPAAPLLICFVVSVAGWAKWRSGALTDRRLALYRIALFGIPLLVCLWLLQMSSFLRGRLEIAPLPFTTPLYILSIGVPALLFFRCRFRIAGLFVGLVVSQLAVAVTFIPLSRLRWTIDGLLIVAIAIGISNLCRWLQALPSLQKR